MRPTLVRSFALLAFVLFSQSASAGIINLSDGSFDPVPPPGNIGSGGPVHFEGDRGFTFDGSVGSVDEGSSVSGCFFCLPGHPDPSFRRWLPAGHGDSRWIVLSNGRYP